MSDAINIILFSFAALFTVNIFYKLLVNQSHAKQVRENIENMNKQLREEQKKGNKEKASQLLGDVMREQGRIMRMSLKPLFISFIIVAVFLYFIGNAYGNMSVQLNDGKGIIAIDGQEYQVEKIGNSIKIGNSECEAPCTKVISNSVWHLSAEENKVNLARIVASLPISLPLIGSDAGFLGWYIIVSIPVMIMLRKLMKIYT